MQMSPGTLEVPSPPPQYIETHPSVVSIRSKFENAQPFDFKPISSESIETLIDKSILKKSHWNRRHFGKNHIGLQSYHIRTIIQTDQLLHFDLTIPRSTKRGTIDSGIQEERPSRQTKLQANQYPPFYIQTLRKVSEHSIKHPF